MPIESRQCPECNTPNEFDVPVHTETWSGKATWLGPCGGCGKGLFYVPGVNRPLWDLGAIVPDPDE
jgi:hypothetical protein